MTFRPFQRRFLTISTNKNKVGTESLSDEMISTASIKECKAQQNKVKELGTIHFRYNSKTFEDAKGEAVRSNKPLMILFDEIPGCCRCLEFGKTVLSQPLIVESAETLFVSVVVNNRAESDEDAQMLEIFHEAKMSNPVVRFVDPTTLKDVAHRVADGLWSVGAVSRAMVESLKQSNVEVPAYLQLVKKEYVAKTGFGQTASTATFGTSSSSVGEEVLAKVDGVIGTEAGWLGRNEVVKVTYDSNVLSYSTLIQHAIKENMASPIYYSTSYEREAARQEIKKEGAEETSQLYPIKASTKIRKNEDSKHSLRQKDVKFVPLTALQACKINMTVSEGDNERIWLSPRQIAILQAIQKASQKPESDFVGVDVEAAWSRLQKDGFFDQ